MDLTHSHDFDLPVRIRFGTGALALLPDEVRRIGVTAVLLVTDPGLVQAGLADQVEAVLRTAGIDCARFAEVEPNPSIGCAQLCAERYRASGSHALVALGGGSVIDAAKAAGILVTSGGDLRSYEGQGKVPLPVPPLIALPTTCGTGSEVTNVTVVTDTTRRYKLPIISPHLVPVVAILDPNFLVGAPAPLIASTGLDALTHAIEAFTNRVDSPFVPAPALQAMRLIGRHLRPAVANANLHDVAQMLLASTLAGMAFGIGRLGLVHAMSHPVTGHAGVPHGVANAILLPHVMAYNLIGNPGRYAQVAVALGDEVQGRSEPAMARRAVDLVRELAADVGIPANLGAVGVTADLIPAMTGDARLSGNVQINPRRAGAEEIAALYRAAIGL